MSRNIWLAASDGDLEALKTFVEEKGVSVDAQDENGYSVLHAAASYGHKDLIKYLLEKGANVNIQDPDMDTPLFVCETVEIAKMLVEAGADAKHLNGNDMTAAENAEEEEWSEVAYNLREITGVSHPENDVDDLEENISHLLQDDNENSSDSSSDSSNEGSSDDEREKNGKNNSFRGRIETIMNATEADGVNRDEELNTVVTEILTTSGPEGAAALSRELQAQESKQRQ
ncbi:hypothetical protein BGZ65_007456 [Modicella reniformis]|uniref:Ankyrin n=1 Tax=Modicella reniformis TaxID=1440133 RepID=A0A9P6MB46_9FUNG|nr:hypothetical protein BGZ65_007456 [Modicella reniformis]